MYRFILGLALALAAFPASAVNYDVAIGGTTSGGTGIIPTVSPSAVNNLPLKQGAANLYSVYAENFSATGGWLLVFDAAAVPADGPVTPKACRRLSPLGYATINYIPGPPAIFNSGIMVVLSSGVDCFTKTTGTITGFISGLVP